MSKKRGNRSQKAKTRRNIIFTLKTKVWDTSFTDYFGAETISQISCSELISYGYEVYGPDFSCTYAPQVVRGEVMVESRGRGTFQ